jgi:hypothetical protein
LFIYVITLINITKDTNKKDYSFEGDPLKIHAVYISRENDQYKLQQHIGMAAFLYINFLRNKFILIILYNVILIII